MLTKKNPKSLQASPNVDMQTVTTVILSGGEGTRLSPLTRSRCKPAVHYAGRYRLIDFPLSSAIHSGCRNIYVLTQFLSHSLSCHLQAINQPKTLPKTSIEIICSENGPLGKTCFQGTADAVRKSFPYFLETAGDYILVLSGDQIYHLDFQDMMQTALQTNADLVIAALPIHADATSRMGVLQIDQKNTITHFLEKPQTKELLSPFLLNQSQKIQFGMVPHEEKNYLGSMGIYLFKKQALLDLLKEDPRNDFGKHLIPFQVAKGCIAAHVHNKYWEDIGTIKSFYEANMALTQPKPIFNCDDKNWPLFTHTHALPYAKINDTRVKHSLLCEEVTSNADEISHSIIGPQIHIEKGCIIQHSYIMGNGSHDQDSHKTFIGKNTHIYKAIIDTDVTIGSGVQLVNQHNIQTFDSDIVTIRDGIIVIPRGVTIPDGYTL